MIRWLYGDESLQVQQYIERHVPWPSAVWACVLNLLGRTAAYELIVIEARAADQHIKDRISRYKERVSRE